MLYGIFNELKQKDPEANFSIGHNDAGEISKIFWINGRQKEVAELFGDLILADTTFKSNILFVCLFVTKNNLSKRLLGRISMDLACS